MRLNHTLEIFMQLSRLYSAIFRLNPMNVSDAPLSLKSVCSSCLSTSVVILGVSQAAWAQTDINTDTQSVDPSVVLDTIVVTSSADASADGLPPAYAGEQVATGSRVGILGNQDIMDTPFSTVSYTNEYITNQQAQSR